VTLPVRCRSRKACWGHLLTVLLLASAATVRGQSKWFGAWGGSTPARPNPAVVRVTAVDADGTSHGSGTLVAVGPHDGLVLTNWHVVRDAVGAITVRFPDGFESAAEVLKTDADWDLAALRIWRPSVPPIPIAHLAPQVGEYLTIAGYGAGRYREFRGRVVQYVAPSSKHPYEMIELNVEARNGDSGGPMLNSRGELAGVLFGAGQGTTAGSYCGRVQRFLADVLPQLGRGSQLAASRPGRGQAPARGQAPQAPDRGQAFSGPAGTPVARGQALPGHGPRTSMPPIPASSNAIRGQAPGWGQVARAAASSGGAGQAGTVPLVPLAPQGAGSGRSATEIARRDADVLPQVSLESPAYVPPPPPRSAPPRRTSPTWSARDIARYLKILGDTPWEQAKTFLAIVGIVSIVMQFMGRREE